MPLPSLSLPSPTVDLYALAGTQDAIATFDELEALKKILRAASGQFEIEMVCEVQTRRAPFPIFPIFPIFTASIGSRDPLAPSIGFVGGILGLERVTSQGQRHGAVFTSAVAGTRHQAALQTAGDVIGWHGGNQLGTALCGGD